MSEPAPLGVEGFIPCRICDRLVVDYLAYQSGHLCLNCITAEPAALHAQMRELAIGAGRQFSYLSVTDSDPRRQPRPVDPKLAKARGKLADRAAKSARVRLANRHFGEYLLLLQSERAKRGLHPLLCVEEGVLVEALRTIEEGLTYPLFNVEALTHAQDHPQTAAERISED
jgi:hypothetical protein